MSHTEGFAYDAMGNRTLATDTATGSSTAYTARPDNAYAGVGGVPATHDANGNMTDTTLGTTLEYDAMNRLTRATRAGTVVEFAYDGLNRCATRTIARPDGTTETIRLVHSDWNLIEERDADGTLTARYTHGATIDDILTRTDASGTIHYHRDGLMSTVALSDAAGDIIERVRYDAFGLPAFTDAEGLPLAESSTGNRFLFTGREWLAEVHLYDHRHRAYSPELGRFLQTDPIRFAAGDGNLYRYVTNAPGDWMDPWGLCGGEPVDLPFDPLEALRNLLGNLFGHPSPIPIDTAKLPGELLPTLDNVEKRNQALRNAMENFDGVSEGDSNRNVDPAQQEGID